MTWVPAQMSPRRWPSGWRRVRMSSCHNARSAGKKDDVHWVFLRCKLLLLTFLKKTKFFIYTVKRLLRCLFRFFEKAAVLFKKLFTCIENSYMSIVISQKGFPPLLWSSILNIPCRRLSKIQSNCCAAHFIGTAVKFHQQMLIS